jgi:hypothetical protein
LFLFHQTTRHQLRASSRSDSPPLLRYSYILNSQCLRLQIWPSLEMQDEEISGNASFTQYYESVSKNRQSRGKSELCLI